MPPRRILPLLLAAAAALLPGKAPAQPAPSIAALRGEVEITIPTTSGPVTLRREDLVGITLDLGGGFGSVRIAAATPDPQDRTSETWLYDLRRQDPATGAWDQPACDADADGRRLALFLAVPGGVAPFCTGVNAAKCVRMGYAPWRAAPDGRSLAPFHLACQRMLPAEYGGDGRYHTRDGTRIEVFDFAGVNDPENLQGLPFEAGWTPEGAVCVAHPRVPEITDAARLAALYPAMAAEGRLGPEACTEDRARALGALVFNRSAAE